MTASTMNRSKAAGLLVLFALTGTGCSTIGPQAMLKETAPTGSPTFVVTMWSNQVYLNPDPVHNGTPIPTLAGNMYLLGEGNAFITARGKVIVDLFDTTNDMDHPVQLERWIFDPDTLKKLLLKDNLGWSWRLILPWGSYRPEITRIELRAAFARDNLAAMYAQPSRITLATPDLPQQMPGAAAQQVARAATQSPNQAFAGQQPGAPVPQSQGPPPMNPPSPGVQQTSHLVAPSMSPAFSAGVPQGSIMMAPSPNPVPPPGVQPSMQVTMPLSAAGMSQPPMNTLMR
jgi:hypothetical protein